MFCASIPSPLWMRFRWDAVPREAVFTRHCVATIVMQNDSYVGGAVCLARSLRDTGATSDLVCLYTRDVSEKGVALLDRFFTHIVEVPYVEHACAPIRWKKFEHMYVDWISRSFTKIQIHVLTMYRKVFFLDADMLSVGNVEPIFRLTTPAGCISDPTGCGLPHGAPIPQGMIARTVRNLYGVSAGCWLLRPSLEDRDRMVRIVESAPVFGDPAFNAGPDEVLTTLFYARPGPVPLDHRAFLALPPVSSTRATRWLNIGREFNCLAWHRRRLDSGRMEPAPAPFVTLPERGDAGREGEKPPRDANGDYPLWYRLARAQEARVPRRTLIIHFATEKPWAVMAGGEKTTDRIWPDFRLWFDTLEEVKRDVEASGDELLAAAARDLLPASPAPEDFVSEEEAERIYQAEKRRRPQRPRRKRSPSS